MTVLMVRYQIQEASVADVEAGIGKVIAGLEQTRPEGVRYALAKQSDGVSIVGILGLDDGVDNPLPGIAAAREYQENLRDWVVGQAPVSEPLEVMGSYRLFG